MNLYLNAKEDKEIQIIIDKCKEHIGDVFNRDLITVAELVDLTLDFITELERAKEKLADQEQDTKEQVDRIRYKYNDEDNYERRG